MIVVSSGLMIPLVSFASQLFKGFESEVI